MKKIAVAAIATIAATTAHAETYRLIHAIGNTEKEIARDLQEGECQGMKEERIKLVQTLGVGGSVTCLPESIFG